MSDEGRVILIVDALNLFTRHYVAHPAITANGEHAGGIVGFLYAIIDLIERYKPEQIIVVWEGGGSVRKRAIFKEYKQHRRPVKLNRYYEKDLPDTVQNRNHQISTLVSLIENIPVCQIYVPDCEADDVIGYLCRYRFADQRKLIASSDHDFYQLLDSNTIIYSPTWKKIVTSNEVREKFKISPANFCLAKSVCGDPSDNIDGVNGVGFKTLAKRFPDMGEKQSMNVSQIVEQAEKAVQEGSKVKAFQNIINSKEKIERNWRLIYLGTSNLAASQIKRINEIVDTFSPVKNKMQMMRMLIHEGIQTFNVDRVFLALNYVNIKKT